MKTSTIVICALSLVGICLPMGAALANAPDTHRPMADMTASRGDVQIGAVTVIDQIDGSVVVVPASVRHAVAHGAPSSVTMGRLCRRISLEQGGRPEHRTVVMCDGMVSL